MWCLVTFIRVKIQNKSSNIMATLGQLRSCHTQYGRHTKFDSCLKRFQWPAGRKATVYMCYDWQLGLPRFKAGLSSLWWIFSVSSSILGSSQGVIGFFLQKFLVTSRVMEVWRFDPVMSWTAMAIVTGSQCSQIP